MLAYIYVARSNLFAASNKEGVAAINNLTPGEYKVYVWHPRMNEDEEALTQMVTISDDADSALEFQISLKRERKRNRRSRY